MKLWWCWLAHLEEELQLIKEGNSLRAMIPVDYVSERLLETAGVKVAGGDEVVDLGKACLQKEECLTVLA